MYRILLLNVFLAASILSAESASAQSTCSIKANDKEELLIKAIEMNDKICVLESIKQGVDINNKTKPALFDAVELCRPEITQILIDNNANPNVKADVDLGFSYTIYQHGPLKGVMKKGYYSNGYVEPPTKRETTPLLALAASKVYFMSNQDKDDCIETVKVLIKGGARINEIGTHDLGRKTTVLDYAFLYRKNGFKTHLDIGPGYQNATKKELCQYLRSKGAKTAQELLIGSHNFKCN